MNRHAADPTRLICPNQVAMMVDTVAEFEDMRADLHRVLALAEQACDPVTWARTAHVLGHVCQRLRALGVAAAEDDAPAGIGRSARPALRPVALDRHAQLKEGIIEMLAIADDLDEPAVGIHLSQALFMLTGHGLSWRFEAV